MTPESSQVIESSYLRNVVIKCFFIFVAGLIATAAIFYVMMQQPIGPTYGAGFKMLAALQQDIFYKSILIYASTVLLVIICIIVITLLYSHRVAGPVYRLTLFARQLRDGNFQSGVNLRRSDVVQPLAGEMNLMSEKFHRTLNDINWKIDELEQLTDKVGKDEKEKLAKIEERAEKIANIISQFKM